MKEILHNENIVLILSYISIAVVVICEEKLYILTPPKTNPSLCVLFMGNIKVKSRDRLELIFYFC